MDTQVSQCKTLVELFYKIRLILEFEKTVNKLILSDQASEESEKENQRPFEGASHIQIQENLEDLKIREKQEQLCKVENINRDVQDLNEMYKNLHEMVGTQAESVDQISENVESAQLNVETGTRSLSKARK